MLLPLTMPIAATPSTTSCQNATVCENRVRMLSESKSCQNATVCV